MRGIPPPGAGGYMRPGMAVPERQPSLYERLKEISYADFSNQTGIRAAEGRSSLKGAEGIVFFLEIFKKMTQNGETRLKRSVLSGAAAP